MISFKLYFEAVDSEEFKRYLDLGFDSNLKLIKFVTPEDKKQYDRIVTNIPLREYNRKQIQAFLDYIQNIKPESSPDEVKNIAEALFIKYHTDLPIKLRLHLAAKFPDLFDYKAAISGV